MTPTPHSWLDKIGRPRERQAYIAGKESAGDSPTRLEQIALSCLWDQLMYADNRRLRLILAENGIDPDQYCDQDLIMIQEDHNDH